MSPTWPVTTLGSLAEFRNGLNYTQEARHRGGLPIVGVKDFQDRSSIEYATLEELDPEAVSATGTLLTQHDILFVRSNGNRDLIGRSLYVAEEPLRQTTYSGFTIRLRFTDSRVDPRFFSYLLRGPIVRRTLSKHGGGTNIANLNQGILGSLVVPLPPLDQQRRIASILSAYDDLIEVNRRRVAILEEMARRLFEEWFVHLRFPGHEAVSMYDTPHGPLPEGWRNVAIKCAYDGLYDGPHATPPEAAEGPIFLGINNITESGRLDLSSVRHISERDFGRWTKRVLPQQGDIVFTYEATLNRYALIPPGFRGCLGRRLALIRANSLVGVNQYLYLYFFTTAWRELVTKNTLSGATVDRIPLTRFPTFSVLLPPANMLSRFKDVIDPIFGQCHALEQTNYRLRRSLDLLLPRLVSGQLSVADAPAPDRLLDAAD